MKNTISISKQQIGKLGELLVQYELLKHGIESASLTTDAGIDLVAYSSLKKKPHTIQVKTNLKPKPGGGRGRPSLDWWAPEESPADLFAFVNANDNQVWLFTNKELVKIAQQHPKGRYHFYIALDSFSELKGKKSREAHISKFERYRLDNRIKEIFG